MRCFEKSPKYVYNRYGGLYALHIYERRLGRC
jgi:hypothetical protein